MPRTQVGFVIAFLRELVVQVLHTFAPKIFCGRRSLENADDELLAARIYSRLAYVYWFHSGRVPCAWAHFREMNLVERYPPTPERAQAYSEHAPVMTMLPWYGRGMEYVQRSLTMRTEFGDVWGQGQSLSFFGVVLYAASRYRECIEQCRAALRLLERTGDRWEANTAAWHIAFSHYRLGELAQAVDSAQRVHRAAIEIGDKAAAGISLSVWARASNGNVPAGLVAAELAKPVDDAHTATEVRLAEGVRRLAAGDSAGAVEMLEDAAATVARAGLRQEYVAPVQPWLAAALRAQAEACSPYAPEERAALVDRAHRAARRGARQARSYRNNLPMALRERALVEAMRGRGRKARRLLDASLAEAEAQDARYERAQTLVALGRLGVELGWPQAAATLRVGEDELTSLTAPLEAAGDRRSPRGETLSLADRFESVVDVGRALTAAASNREVYQSVEDAALVLLRGEQCHVLTGIDRVEDDAVTDSGERLDEVSLTLVRRAIEARAPVVETMGAGDAVESLELSGARSVLCAPITVDGRVTACFYVTHAQVGALFGPEEQRLAAFIAALAGAALEHLAGSEARFRSLVQHSSDVVTIVDEAGRVEYLSSSVQRVFGVEPTAMLGRHIGELVHPDDATTVTRQLEEVINRPGGTVVIECRLRHADGSWRETETTLTNLLDEPGVRGLVLNTRDISELRWQATHDSVTGLPNRALFSDRVAHGLARSRREHVRLAVLFLDLDDFKIVNDRLGHPAGDLLLVGAASRLVQCVRPGDTVARFGGDEFALLLEDADQADAEHVAGRVIEELSRPFTVGRHEVKVHASIGIATAEPDATADHLLAAADVAMYTAKRRSKGGYAVFEEEMRAVAVARSTLQSDLYGAVDRGEMRLQFQPVVDLASGAAVGAEALVRWQHPERGLLSPAEFIPLAEDTGLIVEIGRWVLDEACALAKTWPQGQRPFLAVNVSPRQLADMSFVTSVAEALTRSSLPPTQLVLELTEGAIVSDPDRTTACFSELRDLGVRLAVDDFGTGYSSLTHLRRFPLDLLKIDKSFLDDMETGPEQATLLAAVVRLGLTLGLKIVAEGVERATQLDALRAAGCELAQGYLFARPADPAALPALLSTKLA